MYLTARENAITLFTMTRETAMAGFQFLRDLPGGSTYKLGAAVQYPDGWRFISNVASHKGSRKFHPTMKACLPRWLGFPDKCRSVAIVPKTVLSYPGDPDLRLDA